LPLTAAIDYLSLHDALPIFQDVMNIEAANVFEEANIPEEPVSPSEIKNTLIGVFLGFVIALAAVIISYLTNDTIRTSEEVERYLDRKSTRLNSSHVSISYAV